MEHSKETGTDQELMRSMKVLRIYSCYDNL